MIAPVDRRARYRQSKHCRFSRLTTLNEDIFLDRLATIANPDLRRHLARMVWFDLSDDPSTTYTLHRIKAIADPSRVESGWGFEVAELADGMAAVGYLPHYIPVRVAIHVAQREQRGEVEACGIRTASNSKYELSVGRPGLPVRSVASLSDAVNNYAMSFRWGDY
jgi:hypothetical protein